VSSLHDLLFFVSGTSGAPQPWRKRAEYRSGFATSAMRRFLFPDV
jgi:hypothetical protein